MVRLGYTGCMNSDNTLQIDTILRWLGTGSINLFGRPFAGKDSQGHELAALFDAPLLGGGEILRNSVIPAHVKTALDSGLLVPSQDYISIITPFLSSPNFQHKPLILSSLGRWIGEEEGVMGALDASQHPLRVAIYLDIDDDTVHKRWHISQQKKDRGERAEDAEELLEVRLEEFRNKTLPVIDVYRQRGLLLEIDATLPRDEVLRLILAKLEERAQTSR